MRFALFILLMGPFSVSGAPAWAQIAVDPTRPPSGIFTDMPDDSAPGNELQSVMISPTRRAAIISGVVVELGAKYGDAVLMRVAEDEVVLRRGNSRQVLKLYPAVERVDVARAVPGAPAAVESAPRKTKSKPEPRRKAPSVKDKAKANAPDGTGAAAVRETEKR